MVLLIAGSTHTGKTLLAQRVLEERGWPYLSLDHLKMGDPEWSDLADAGQPGQGADRPSLAGCTGNDQDGH